MYLAEFDYHLPPELIAQTPIEPRHAARLMVIDRASGQITHKQVADLPQYMPAGDMLVANNSRVIPARLHATKATGGKMELLLLKQLDEHRWEALAGGKRLREGTKFQLNDKNIQGEIEVMLDGPKRVVRFEQPLSDYLAEFGQIPLPPYIQQPLADPERYQTVYSQPAGSAAAPTAGLHFSPDLLLTLREQGILLDYVTLHVGLDTFKPVEVNEIEQHTIHSEWSNLSPETARRMNETKLAGKKVWAVGTTSVRTLETAALRSAGISGSLKAASQLDPNLCPWRAVTAFSGPTDLYIYPGFTFRATDHLLTNFHLPKSSLLMLVGAFMGLDLLHQAYALAIAEKYRFYSFGDAMLIL